MQCVICLVFSAENLMKIRVMCVTLFLLRRHEKKKYVFEVLRRVDMLRNTRFVVLWMSFMLHLRKIERHRRTWFIFDRRWTENYIEKCESIQHIPIRYEIWKNYERTAMWEHAKRSIELFQILNWRNWKTKSNFDCWKSNESNLTFVCNCFHLLVTLLIQTRNTQFECAKPKNRYENI